MKPLDRFIHKLPRLVIKQFSYAWVPFVLLWNSSTGWALLSLLVLVIGMLMLRRKPALWVEHIRQEYAPDEGKFYVDEPGIPWGRAVRNITILFIGCGLIAYLIGDRFGLTSLKLFFLIAGFTMIFQGSRYFGAPSIYIITATGIAVYFAPGLTDYRLFLTFKEISKIERTGFEWSQGWDIFARTRHADDGLLIVPKSDTGFTKFLKMLFIVPQDIDKFLEQLPYGYK